MFGNRASVSLYTIENRSEYLNCTLTSGGAIQASGHERSVVGIADTFGDPLAMRSRMS